MFVVSLFLRYVVFYAVAVVLLIAAAAATGYWVGGLIGSLIPTMFASLMCGVAYARRTGRRAPAEVAWGASALFVVLSAAGGFAVFALLAPDEVMAELVRITRISPVGMLLIVSAALLASVVASRIFFGLGSRTRHGPAGA